MNLINRLKQNKYVLSCIHCLKPVYKYVGPIPIEPTRAIIAQDFQPVDETILPPRPGDYMLCPYCKNPLLSEVPEVTHDRSKSTN